MFRKSISILLATLAFLAILAPSSGCGRKPRPMTEAVELYNAGQYAEASELFSQMNSKEAEEWLEKCSLKLTEQEADSLTASGKPEEALALLKEKAPDSERILQTVEACAEQLIDSGRPDEAMELLKREAPGSALLAACEQAMEEQRFLALLEGGSLEEAETCLTTIREMNGRTGRLAEKQLNDLDLRLKAKRSIVKGSPWYDDAFNCYFELNDETGMQEAIQAMKDAGSYGDALKAYQKLNDAEGMQAAIQALEAGGKYEYLFDYFQEQGNSEGMLAELDAMEAAGKFSTAFSCAVRAGEYQTAQKIFSRITDPTVSETGGLLYSKELAVLKKLGTGETDTLAAQIENRCIEDCRAMIASGKDSAAYEALEDLLKSADDSGTEEIVLLMNSCTEEMPEKSGIFRDDSGLQQKAGAWNTATITVHNKNRTQGLLLALGMRDGNTGTPEIQVVTKRIYVFICPASDYTFTVLAGNYEASAAMGETWFGREGFGINADWKPVEIRNGQNTVKQGSRLEGSYSMTVQ